VIPLNEVNDPTFAAELLGKGVAIKLTEGKVYAPVDGTITALLDSHHAIGITSDEGVEILIHVGLDTVELNEQYYMQKIENSQEIKKGQLLLEFDTKQINDAGYETTTPDIITKSAEFDDVETIVNQTNTHGEKIINIS